MKHISLILLSIIALLYSSCNSDSRHAKVINPVTGQQQAEHLIAKGVKQLANSQVCMVNDEFMNADQIAVPIDGKTYYGCCAGCVANLKKDTTYRLTTDLVTGDRVDKANAVIILKQGTKDQVLYFKSETTAKIYIERGDRK